ncbi:MAG: hypothetical protein ACT4PM_06745 [Gemmatimonadales bacterium]
MITYWVDSAGAFGIGYFLSGRGQSLRERFSVRVYDFAASTLEAERGPQIFSALDQLTAPEREAVGILRDRIAQEQPQARLLNDPRRSLLRGAVLERMAAEGLNRFRAYPARAPREVSRFPVFVRGLSEHTGSLTGLLCSSTQLRRGLRALRVRGHRLDDLLIVEFCDTSDRSGVFRKYSAMRVGDAIVPAHVLAGRDWLVKADTAERTLDSAREELAFVEKNPHERWLRTVFALAGVEYGRADYAVLNGAPQLWEINLNPTIGRQPGKPRRQMDPEVAEVWERARQLAAAQLRAAFVGLNGGPPGEAVTVTFPPALRSQIARAVRNKRRRARALGLLSKIYDSGLGAPLRAVLPRILTRR